MQTAILEGKIGEKFGREWPIEGCNSIKDTFKLINCQTEGFTQYLIEAAENNIDFSIQRGVEFIGEEELLLSISNEDLIITEIPAGQKSGGAKIIAAMIITYLIFGPMAPMFQTSVQAVVGTGTQVGTGAATFNTVTVYTGLNTAGMMLAMVAANLAISGITQLMAKGPETDASEENKGYLFNGPVNTVQQGLPVPVAYGELTVGGAVISIAFQAGKWMSTEITAFDTADAYAGVTGLAIRNTTAYAGSYGSGELMSVHNIERD